jgi:quercetin dioxygenase-like cupin family protein
MRQVGLAARTATPPGLRSARPGSGSTRLTLGPGCYPFPSSFHERTAMPTSSGSVTWYRWEDVPTEPVSELLSRMLITGDRMMLAQVFLKKGCIVPRHHHENEQLTYIVSGALRFWIGEDESEVVMVRAGEVLHIPSNVPHKAEAVEDTLDVDIFSPPRQDWIDKTDAYLRK